MTNTSIPTLSRQPLYCVWIETGNPAHPLDRVWIDPELRSFVDVEIAPTRATNDENEPEASVGPVPQRGLFAGRLFTIPFTKAMKGKTRSAMKRCSWVVILLCFLLHTACADMAGRISGMVNDPSGAFVAGATVRP
jgi:hypothetical protein